MIDGLLRTSMKILFDQGVPAPLRRAFSGHTVATAYELGWAQLTMERC